MPFDQLPEDVVESVIFPYLPLRDKWRTKNTSSYLHSVGQRVLDDERGRQKEEIVNDYISWREEKDAFKSQVRRVTRERADARCQDARELQLQLQAIINYCNRSDVEKLLDSILPCIVVDDDVARAIVDENGSGGPEVVNNLHTSGAAEEEELQPLCGFGDFPDYELGGGNLGDVSRDIGRMIDIHETVLQLFKIMTFYDGFLTQKVYMGNGGGPSAIELVGTVATPGHGNGYPSWARSSKDKSKPSYLSLDFETAEKNAESLFEQRKCILKWTMFAHPKAFNELLIKSSEWGGYRHLSSPLSEVDGSYFRCLYGAREVLFIHNVMSVVGFGVGVLIRAPPKSFGEKERLFEVSTYYRQEKPSEEEEEDPAPAVVGKNLQAAKFPWDRFIDKPLSHMKAYMIDHSYREWTVAAGVPALSNSLTTLMGCIPTVELSSAPAFPWLLNELIEMIKEPLDPEWLKLLNEEDRAQFLGVVGKEDTDAASFSDSHTQTVSSGTIEGVRKMLDGFQRDKLTREKLVRTIKFSKEFAEVWITLESNFVLFELIRRNDIGTLKVLTDQRHISPSVFVGARFSERVKMTEKIAKEKCFESGDSLLHVACRSRGLAQGVVRLLLSPRCGFTQDCFTSLKNDAGQTPLDVMSPKMKKILNKQSELSGIPF